MRNQDSVRGDTKDAEESGCVENKITSHDPCGGR